VLPVTALILVLAGCSGGAGSNSATGAPPAPGHQPLAATAADWKPVTDTLGRTGKFGDNNTVYRIPLTRTDLNVVTGGIAIKPGLSLGGYAAFAKYDDGAMMMGDLVVTEAELPKVHRRAGGPRHRPDRAAQASAPADTTGVVDPHRRDG